MFVFTNIVIDVQIPTKEDLLQTESVNFPSVSNTPNNSIMLDKMAPGIQIPSSIIINQISEQGYASIVHVLKK